MHTAPRAWYIRAMAKLPVEPPLRTEIPIDPDRPKRAQAAAVQPKALSTTPINRPGIGQKKGDGRRSGGTFSLKVVTIEHDDTKRRRELRVPLHMEYTDYPTLQPFETVVAEAEEHYGTIQERDHVLSEQVDPYWTRPVKGPDGRMRKTNSLGFGTFDPLYRNDEVAQGGGAWYNPESDAAQAAAAQRVVVG